MGSERAGDNKFSSIERAEVRVICTGYGVEKRGKEIRV